MRKLLLVTTILLLSVMPSLADVIIDVDKTTQQMTVTVDDQPTYHWKVSTGRPGYDTPDGVYIPPSMNVEWYSHEYGNVPMPHAIFINTHGIAIHGFTDIQHLGTAVSHGCIRLSPENATTLYALVEEQTLDKTRVIVHGTIPVIRNPQPEYNQQYQQVPPQQYYYPPQPPQYAPPPVQQYQPPVPQYINPHPPTRVNPNRYYYYPPPIYAPDRHRDMYFHIGPFGFIVRIR